MATSSSASELFDSPLPSPRAAIDQLQTSREAILDYQTQVEARFKAAGEEVLKAQALAQAARDQVLQEQTECARWKDNCASVESEKVALQAESKQLREQLEAQKKHSRNLNAELLEVYRDLRSEDLPTLILRVGMNLVGAENGLFVGANGDVTLASVGLDNLPEPIAQALYRFTREAAESEEPVICNDSKQLPDHEALINLAALPVSVKNDLKGVILVANKRDGIFDDDDTELLLAIGKHAGIALENQRLHCALGDAFISTVAVLADAVEAKDPYTRGHCEGVSDLAARVAERMSWDKSELDQIRYAALLHDVGKLGIPDSILMKPSHLLPEEFTLIKTHVTIGRDLVARVPALEHITPIVYHHHERWDGGGYPSGLSGEEIPLGARIVGAVDALDAMITKRPYRDAMTLQAATAELQLCAGKQFDPYVIEHLVEVLEDRAPSAFA